MAHGSNIFQIPQYNKAHHVTEPEVNNVYQTPQYSASYDYNTGTPPQPFSADPSQIYKHIPQTVLATLPPSPTLTNEDTSPSTAKSKLAKRNRTVYTSLQLTELERAFRNHQYCNVTRRFDIAEKLKLCERQVKVWFQNRRIKQGKISKAQHSGKIRGGSLSKKKNPRQAIVRRLMSYSQEMKTIPAVEAAPKVGVKKIVEGEQLKNGNTIPAPIASSVEPIRNTMILSPPTLPLPVVMMPVDNIDLNDVLECVNADQASSSTPASTMFTMVRSTDWLIREDIVDKIHRELEASAAEYAAGVQSTNSNYKTLAATMHEETAKQQATQFNDCQQWNGKDCATNTACMDWDAATHEQPLVYPQSTEVLMMPSIKAY